MSSRESSERWNERQASLVEQDQPQRSPCEVGESIELLKHHFAVERRIQAGIDKQTIAVINDLLDLINPINDHDHRVHGCRWCRAKRDAIEYCEFLRRKTDAAR